MFLVILVLLACPGVSGGVLHEAGEVWLDVAWTVGPHADVVPRGCRVVRLQGG